MAYALEGIKVVDLSQMWAVPGSGMYLGDQGADVIKVEPPWGDEGRRLLTASPVETARGPLPRHFLPLNRNKRGMAVDITTGEGKDVVRKLVEKADVLLHNYRPEAAGRLGLDYDSLRTINPRLIYLFFTPFGTKGPYAGKPAYDRVVQALSGAQGRRHLPDGTPLSAGVWIADCASPMLIAYGIALALYMREKTGEGQKVEVSLLGGAIAMQSVDLVKAEREEEPRSFADQAMYAPYCCQDGRYLTIVVVSEKEWQALCRALEVEHLANDSRFKSHHDRAENSDLLYSILEGIFSIRPRDEWLKALEEADVPCAPILTPQEVLYHPQLVENELIVEVEDARMGKVRMMGIPVKLSGAPGAIRRSAPDLGEHTDEVLAELGYSRAKIEELRQKKVVA
ncbi:MAG: CoA transferase [Chloroflexota bacterium]|nr:CoA transferase [Chloroflexota bacterium]